MKKINTLIFLIFVVSIFTVPFFALAEYSVPPDTNVPPVPSISSMYLPKMPSCVGNFGTVINHINTNDVSYGYHYDNDASHFVQYVGPTTTIGGNALDWYWIYTWRGGSITWDLGKLINKVRVYPSIDYTPTYSNALAELKEFSQIQVSSDSINWITLSADATYVDDYNNVRAHDGVKDYHSNTTFRYVKIAPSPLTGDPADDLEIDAVQECGLNAPICTLNATQKCVGNSVYNFDSCNNQGSLVQACSTNQMCSNAQCVSIACNTNSDCGTNSITGSQFCQDNSVYQGYKTYTCNNPGTQNAYCSNTTNNQLQQTCLYNQSCSNGSCTNSCTNHYSKRCVNSGVYWFDSCGTRQELYQVCTGNQTCSNSDCVNQITGIASVSKLVRNTSTGNPSWSNSTYANPSDTLQFQITVQNSSSQIVNNITVRDTFPANLYYRNNLILDNAANFGDITSGIVIGNLFPGQTKVITYRAEIAPSQNFVFGTTTLTNAVSVTNTGAGYNQNTSTASVIVTKTQIFGATSVSTGLTDNFFVDSFFLPLALALIGVWLYKSGLIRLPALLVARQIKYKNYIAGKRLDKKIAEIRQREM